MLGVLSGGKRAYAKSVSEGEARHGFIEPVAVTVEDGSLLDAGAAVALNRIKTPHNNPKMAPIAITAVLPKLA